MKKTNKLFNIFLLVTLVLTVLATIFSALSLFLTYEDSIANIKIVNFASIAFIVFSTLAVITPVVGSIVIKDFKITRAKSNMVFIKVASVLLALFVAILALYDFVALLKGLSSKPVVFATWKFLRIFASIPFILHLIFQALPEKTKIPSFVRYTCAFTPVVWSLFSVLAIYFHQGPTPVPEFFRITFSIIYIFASLFFLYDFKWNSLESNTRIYITLVTMFTLFTLLICTSSLVFICSGVKGAVINAVEMSTLLVCGIFGLSRLISIKRAVSVTAQAENANTDTHRG